MTGLSFAAFYVWWDGEERGRVGPARWVTCVIMSHLASLGEGAAARGLLRLWGRGLYPAETALGADLGMGTGRGSCRRWSISAGPPPSVGPRIDTELAALHAHQRRPTAPL